MKGGINKMGYKVLYKTPQRKRFTDYGFRKFGKKEDAESALKKETKKYPTLKGKYWKWKIVKKV